MPKRVVTIHGLDTTGNWQEQVERVFTPHFECVNFKYAQYQSFGAVRLAFGNVWLLIVALFVFGVLTAGLYFRNTIVVLIALICLALVVVAGLLVARNRRSQLLDQFKIELDARVPFGDSPHLIAHSLGTFLCGNALVKFPNLKFDRIVFCRLCSPSAFCLDEHPDTEPQGLQRIEKRDSRKGLDTDGG